MPAPKRYYLKRRLAKAMHSIWSQDWKPNGVMAQKWVAYKSQRIGMRTLRLVNLPDGKVKMMCQLSKEEIEALVKNGHKVKIISPVDNGHITTRQRMHQRRMRQKGYSLHNFRKLVKKGQLIGDTSQRAEMEQMYWAVVEIARQMERVILTLPDDDRKKPGGLFRDFVDESKLALCFKKVSVDFYGIDRKEALKGSDKDTVTFIGYLFILVEHEHLGNSNFSEKGINPFFRFIIDHGIVHAQCTPRTFYNRLKGALGTFRDRMLSESRDSKFQNDYWRANIYLQNFLKVREIFRGTDYYKELEPLLRKVL